MTFIDERWIMENTIEQRVKNIVAIKMGLVAGDLKNEQHFINDMGADSIDEIELIFSLEEEFGILLSDEQAEKIKTVQQAIDYVTEHAPG